MYHFRKQRPIVGHEIENLLRFAIYQHRKAFIKLFGYNLQYSLFHRKIKLGSFIF